MNAKILFVTTRLLVTTFLIGAIMQASPQGISPPDVPDKIKTPAGEQVVLKAQASGSQIYVCQGCMGTEGTGS